MYVGTVVAASNRLTAECFEFVSAWTLLAAAGTLVGSVDFIGILLVDDDWILDRLECT